jgi:poly(3-hydroxybutyrate) depolymerase
MSPIKLSVVGLALTLAACGNSGSGNGGDSPGTGGQSVGVGGSNGTGGSPPNAGTGGAVGTGGVGNGAGGATGAGGAAAGGASGTGGSNASGGRTGQGGGAGGALGGSGGAGGGGGSAGAVPSAGCGKTRTLQDGNRTITSSGMSRTYNLKTPANYNNQHPYRLIFMFHWNFGSINAIVNPPDADHNTDRPYYGLADLSGDTTIFVVPMGLITSTGGAGWDNPNNRDVILVDDMLAAVTADLCIDTSRVFTTGFSFGASMSYELACTRPTKFRGALVYEVGTLSGQNAAQCTTPVAWFQSEGIDDQVLTYAGNGLPILNVFTRANGCTAMTPPTPATNGHSCINYAGCSAGHPIRFCNFGAGENNPFNTTLRGHYPVPKDPGQTTSWVPMEAWNFITQF